MTQIIDITPLQDWVTDVNTETVALPSGKGVKLRHIDPIEIINKKEGKIPNLLMGIANQLFNGANGASNAGLSGGLTSDDVMELHSVVNTIAKAALVYPKIIEAKEDYDKGNGLYAYQIPLFDKISIFVWTIGGSAMLENATSFLDGQQVAGLESLQQGSKNGQ